MLTAAALLLALAADPPAKDNAYRDAKQGDWVEWKGGDVVTQEEDGHWPQNMWVSGEPFWDGIQVDQAAQPILLTDLALREGAIDEADRERTSGRWCGRRPGTSCATARRPSWTGGRRRRGTTPTPWPPWSRPLLAAADWADAAGEADLPPTCGRRPTPGTRASTAGSTSGARAGQGGRGRRVLRPHPPARGGRARRPRAAARPPPATGTPGTRTSPPTRWRASTPWPSSGTGCGTRTTPGS